MVPRRELKLQRESGEQLLAPVSLRKIHPAPSIRTWEHTDIQKSKEGRVRKGECSHKAKEETDCRGP